MLSFNFIVDNIGDASSSSTKIEFYRSSNATFNASDDAKLSPEKSIPSICAGSSNGYYSKTLFASDFEYGLSGYWYIIARIKAEDKNTSNNTVAVKVYFNPSRSSFSTATAKTTAPQKNMKVYTFSGVQVIDKTVSSEQEEWETVKSLQPGLYIVKSGDKTYKVKN
ncbi:T9SS type A sorting domain-containing protein [Zunongwangia pacifica]|uniref:T9SS type A sorting domain-containing protein n=1 Tax=Zunongwangia pacifica TaxID=2911062 RepID=A0A9X1ZMT2_9FLAO|nr:T9SS type A sorting domain-containing protein [Zunongwangia pacifica]MCL6216714.1 T9SS type A sorting domain-containing protein [Zunongwangia pacifica]